MKTMVTAVLAKSEVTKIKFSYSGITVDANSFKRVVAAINGGKIQVKHIAEVLAENKKKP